MNAFFDGYVNCKTPLFEFVSVTPHFSKYTTITKYRLTSPTGVMETLYQWKQWIEPDSLTKAK